MLLLTTRSLRRGEGIVLYKGGTVPLALLIEYYYHHSPQDIFIFTNETVVKT